MLVPNRHKDSDDYRYGFQGQEMDNELKGEGNSLDFGERMYDPRVGRWFKIDPQASQMPQVSPYSFALNNPIYLTDEDGEIPIIPFLLKATASAAADALLQASMIYLTDDSVKDFGSAFKKIDKSDVAWSFVEGLNPFKVPGGKAGKAAAVATADLLIYVGEQTLAGEEVSASEAGGEFIRGFLSELAGDQAGKLLSNKKVREKVGALIGEKELNKIVEKVNKNSNAAEGHFVLYQIDDGDEILKIGKADAGRTTASGLPVRMKASERAAQKTNPNAKARVIEDLGITTTGQAKVKEATAVRGKRAEGHKLPKNKERDKRYRNE